MQNRLMESDSFGMCGIIFKEQSWCASGPVLFYIPSICTDVNSHYHCHEQNGNVHQRLRIDCEPDYAHGIYALDDAGIWFDHFTAKKIFSHGAYLCHGRCGIVLPAVRISGGKMDADV